MKPKKRFRPGQEVICNAHADDMCDIFHSPVEAGKLPQFNQDYTIERYAAFVNGNYFVAVRGLKCLYMEDIFDSIQEIELTALLKEEKTA